MLITAERILTGVPGAHLSDGAVLVHDDTVVAVGPIDAVRAQAAPDEDELAFPGATLLPGLIDAHVHLCFDAGTDPVATLQSRDDAALLADMSGRAEQLLDHGVTTVRDLGDRGGLALRLAQLTDEGTVAGPRIVSAGAPITPPGGHCWFLGGEASGEDRIRSLVRRTAAAGAGVVKVMATGGALTEGGAATWESQFAPAELAALVEEAHAAGLPVAAHAHGADGIEAALNAGVDTLEHCTWMTEDGFELREDVLARIVERGVHVCPTASPHWALLPKVFGAERAEILTDQVRRMAEAGVRLIAGTDAGVQRAGFGGLAASLGFFEHVGMDRGRVVEMATGEAARALGIGDTTGRVAAGYRADLLVVEGNPLDDLTALRSVRAVFAGGRPHRPGPSA